MSRAQPPPGIEIAALKQRQQTGAYFDPMTPGPGTPWEDRGSHGTVGAFFKTCVASLKSPIRLLYSIRRPETTHEATMFAIGCGLMWGVSWFIHSMLLVPHYNRQPYTTVDMQWYVIGSLLQLAAGTAGTVGLLKLYNSLYAKMVAGEAKGRVPPALIYNVHAYCLGPSVLAVIPVIGPPLALLWIAVLLALAGFKRYRVISVSGSIIATIVALVCLIAISVGVYFAGMFLWYQVTGGAVIVEPPPKIQGAP